MYEKTTGQLLKLLSSTQNEQDLNQYLHQYTLPEDSFSFHKAFIELLTVNHLTKSAVIHHSGIDRTYAYQILNGTKKPGRDKILALCISAHLPLSTIQRLLELSKEGILYSRSARDAAIIYGIEHHLNVMQINELLERQEEAILE